MKKQIFLLSLLCAGPNISFTTSDCCSSSSSCSSSCNSSCSSSCNDKCVLEHGLTYRRYENTFQNATPVFVSMWGTDVVRDLEQDDKHGGLEITVFGGKNTHHKESAAYFFPYGHTHYTFDGSIDQPITFAKNFAWDQVMTQGNAVAIGPMELSVNTATPLSPVDSLNIDPTSILISADSNTYSFDPNKDTSKILPWNFGITYAALFEPLGASAQGQKEGTGLISNPAFKSTIDPKYFFSNIGAGIALRYHFSDDKQGFWGRISTAVEHVKSKFCLGENVLTPKTALTNDNFPEQNFCTDSASQTADNPYGLTSAELADYCTLLGGGTAALPFEMYSGTGGTGSYFTAPETPLGSINQAYLNGTTGTYFPVDQEVTYGASNAPANVTEAFNQSAWKYGKIGCTQQITRLADIELLFGYQWLCSDCASTDWYIGMVIPTGNKPCATYVAPAVVGNGQHFGLMSGGSIELMLSENENRCVWYRIDLNGRYLFQNTQKRSFDLYGNEWSRYMMVWENKDAYSAAVDYVNTGIQAAGDTLSFGNANRNYTPGINVFTSDMKVTPRLQARINQAVYFRAECFRAELGWNLFARSKECVKFACNWDQAPAFADASYIAGIGLNNNRTIYNDSQTTCFNATASLVTTDNSLEKVINLTNTAINSDDNKNTYDQFAISQDQVNLDSAASPAALIHTPYASLGYAWSSDCKPAVSVGGEYSFSLSNSAINKWMVFGKFECAF
ncbi:hypothetical protein HYV11_03595 [Candidatus Dependentiae bacterium]|nr:hypothetical protein [Candidatus Dependentiae bacterium]